MASVSLEQHWHPIAPAGEIDGQPRQYMLLGQRLVAFRDAEDAVVFKDVCIHRGAELSGGWIDGGRLTCPYHGWQYDRTGACVHIPSLPDGATIPSKARAIKYNTREAYGLVWVAMAERAAAFPEWPEDAWKNPAYHVFMVGDYTWDTSAGRAVENAMDFSHFNFVHKGFTELADGPVIKNHGVTQTEHGLSYEYDDGARLRQYTLHFPFVLHDKKTVTPAALAARGKGIEGGTWSESANSKPGDATILTFIASPIDANACSVSSRAIIRLKRRTHRCPKDSTRSWSRTAGWWKASTLRRFPPISARNCTCGSRTRRRSPTASFCSVSSAGASRVR